MKRSSTTARTTHSLDLGQARRIALAAQGLHEQRKATRPTLAQVVKTVERLGLIQMDSVNVLVRSHYLPLYSRLGNYDAALLDRAAYTPDKRRLFEYWAHEASLLPIAAQPLLRWRMQRARDGIGTWKRVAAFLNSHRAFVDEILAQISDRGALSPSQMHSGTKKSRPGWWQWSEAKTACECLFWTGEVTTVARRNFERIYDLTERVIPADIFGAATPADADAQRQLVEIAARALGVATESDLRDYFRLALLDARARVAELVEAGRLRPVQVEGWRQPAYLHVDAVSPRKVSAHTLLSPFDSLIWERPRAERLFDFRFRLEIYTPAHKRVHGYYVLPFLLRDRIVARLDLKSDRQNKRLQVIAAHLESHAQADAVVEPLWEELQSLSAWLGLEKVSIGRRGALTKALRRHS